MQMIEAAMLLLHEATHDFLYHHLVALHFTALNPGKAAMQTCLNKAMAILMRLVTEYPSSEIHLLPVYHISSPEAAKALRSRPLLSFTSIEAPDPRSSSTTLSWPCRAAMMSGVLPRPDKAQDNMSLWTKPFHTVAPVVPDGNFN